MTHPILQPISTIPGVRIGSPAVCGLSRSRLRREDSNVWTKRIGNNPRIKLLLLHGGPGCTHEYFEAFDSFLPAAGIEYYYYDQLGSYYSDQPEDDRLWELPRFVEEVEQVRAALGLDAENFFSRPVLGRHPRARIRAEVSAAPQGPDHLQHDGEHPGL